jgi:hypothetical protein
LYRAATASGRGVVVATVFPTRYQPHGQWRHLEVDATGRDRVYGWLSVGCHVSGVSRPGVGLVTPTPNGHLPALFGGPFHVQLATGGTGGLSVE